MTLNKRNMEPWLCEVCGAEIYLEEKLPHSKHSKETN